MEHQSNMIDIINGRYAYDMPHHHEGPDHQVGSRPGEGPGHIPPHLRNSINVDLDEDDLMLLPLIFGNQEDAYASVALICSRAPAEMKVQFIQLMELIKTTARRIGFEVLCSEIQDDSVEEVIVEHGDRTGYPHACLGPGAKVLYEKLYGDRASEYLRVLWCCGPKEPPIISRMIAYLNELLQREVK